MKSSFSQEDLESKLESYLNEFYHQRIVPLEKQIMRLGGRLDFEGNQDNINLKFSRFLPKNPFRESRENIHYWEDENSFYYRFFKSLFEWLALPEKKASRILTSRSCDLNNEEQWEEYFNWFIITGETLLNAILKTYK